MIETESVRFDGIPRSSIADLYTHKLGCMMATDPQPHDKNYGAKPKLICSFCRKDQDQVRKLIAGPAVYICDECVDVCNDLIEGECEHELPVGERPQPTMLEVDSRCVLCHLPKASEELV